MTTTKNAVFIGLQLENCCLVAQRVIKICWNEGQSTRGRFFQVGGMSKFQVGGEDSPPFTPVGKPYIYYICIQIYIYWENSVCIYIHIYIIYIYIIYLYIYIIYIYIYIHIYISYIYIYTYHIYKYLINKSHLKEIILVLFVSDE